VSQLAWLDGDAGQRTGLWGLTDNPFKKLKHAECQYLPLLRITDGRLAQPRSFELRAAAWRLAPRQLRHHARALPGSLRPTAYGLRPACAATDLRQTGGRRAAQTHRAVSRPNSLAVVALPLRKSQCRDCGTGRAVRAGVYALSVVRHVSHHSALIFCSGPTPDYPVIVFFLGGGI
jgi:hypothetical protein